MKQIIKISLLIFIGVITFACSQEDNKPYGPDYEIKDIKLEVEGGEFYNDTIPADEFKLTLTLLSDNDYAQHYGLSPTLKSKISNIQVLLENYKDLPLMTSSDISSYFLVEDGYTYNRLYETIEQYTQKEQIRSLRPFLIFTNQASLSAKAPKLITSTTEVQIKVMLTLDGNKTISKQIKTVLKP